MLQEDWELEHVQDAGPRARGCCWRCRASRLRLSESFAHSGHRDATRGRRLLALASSRART